MLFFLQYTWQIPLIMSNSPAQSYPMQSDPNPHVNKIMTASKKK